MSTQDSSDYDPAIAGDLFEAVPDGTDEPRLEELRTTSEAPTPADLARKGKPRRFGSN